MTLDRSVIGEGLHIGGHARHPVAEEHIDVLVLERLIGHRHGEHLDFGLIAQRLEQDVGDARRRLDVGPAHIRKTHLLAGLGVAGGGRSRHGRQAGAKRQHAKNALIFMVI